MHNHPLHRPVRLAFCNLNIPKLELKKKKYLLLAPLCLSASIPKTDATHHSHTQKPSCEIKAASSPQVSLNPEHDMKRAAQLKYCKLKFLFLTRRSFINMSCSCTMQTSSIQTCFSATEKQKKMFQQEKNRSQSLIEWVTKTELDLQLLTKQQQADLQAITTHSNKQKVFTQLESQLLCSDNCF